MLLSSPRWIFWASFLRGDLAYYVRGTHRRDQTQKTISASAMTRSFVLGLTLRLVGGGVNECVQRSGRYPALKARDMSCARSRAPTLLMARFMWVFTVRGERKKRLAISALLRPSTAA